MDVFLTNLSCVLLTVICIIVFSFISASDIMDDTENRRLRDERHMIDVPPLTDGDEQSPGRLGHSAHECSDAVTKLTNAVTQYANCASKHALNSRVCERCVDCYLTVTGLVATNFSVHIFVDV